MWTNNMKLPGSNRGMSIFSSWFYSYWVLFFMWHYTSQTHTCRVTLRELQQSVLWMDTSSSILYILVFRYLQSGDFCASPAELLVNPASQAPPLCCSSVMRWSARTLTMSCRCLSMLEGTAWTSDTMSTSVGSTINLWTFVPELHYNKKNEVNLDAVWKRLRLHGLLCFFQEQEGALTSLCQTLQALRGNRRIYYPSTHHSIFHLSYLSLYPPSINHLFLYRSEISLYPSICPFISLFIIYLIHHVSWIYLSI